MPPSPRTPSTNGPDPLDPQPPTSPSQSNIPGITLRDGFRFREGQAAFLEKLAEAFSRGETNHLGVFVPGYGKTITALASFVVARHLGIANRLVVFVPRGNLRDQYADAEELAFVFRSLGAPPFTFCVADSERVFLKNLDTQIIITTYQYASGEGGNAALLEYCQRGRCLFVFDEVHHLADDGLWAEKVGRFPHAASVALSGTPLRSDNKTLFGVPFEADADGNQYYVALHEVTLRQAHAEGRILKRVKAHVVDYKLRMVQADTGEEVELSLSEMADAAPTSRDVDAYLARQKLRFHEVYLDTLLRPAFERFAEKRRQHRQDVGADRARPERNHQMLIIAMSNRHAAAVLGFVRRRFPGVSAARIGQDLPGSECRRLLADFRDGFLDVMVQVDMIGEGTDIKPISVIVKADLVRAYSKTLQQVFRGMRYVDGFSEAGNLCDLYAADDSGIVHTLRWLMAEQQIGVKQRPERAEQQAPPPPGAPTERSAWELKAVEERGLQTHALDPFSKAPAATPPRPQVLDVNAREQELRKACAGLATELAFKLEARGRAASVREIHFAAKKRFSKAQADLSLRELEQKKRWLERCVRAGRMV